jgi:hypothetical protein
MNWVLALLMGWVLLSTNPHLRRSGEFLVELVQLLAFDLLHQLCDVLLTKE